MLFNLKEIEGFTITATDGDIGKVRDFYFDDETWAVRYLVVDTGNRHVLISPIALGAPNWVEKILPAAVTQAQVANSPDVDTNKPVSRQHEMGYLGYYEYTDYWGGGGLWGPGIRPDVLQAGLQPNSPNKAIAHGGHALGKGKAAKNAHRLPSDVHLQSVNAVTRYYVHASDGDIGHVQGIIVDESTWAVCYFIVDTSNWWLGHSVLIAPEWIEDVYWVESKLVVSLSRQAVKDAPAYDPKSIPDQAQEEAVHSHYGLGVAGSFKARRGPAVEH
jgi:uncharacterized protein YrrD